MFLRSPQLRELLRPFTGSYLRYLACVSLRQALLVAGGYSLVWALRVSIQHRAVPEWTLVGAFILYDFAYLGLDLRMNYFFSSRISFPLFSRLRTAALAKVLDMPMEWHQRQNSGALVGKINNGVGKVVQTAEGMSRELIPALIQTALSLIPLLLISPRTAPLLLPALLVFLWLAILENRARRPFAKRRYRYYARDYALFSESVQAIEPVVFYGQQEQIMRRYRRVQSCIVKHGLTEAKIGKRYAMRRNLATSIARRACQGVWIWQYRNNAIDAASIIYLSMLTDQLLASFSGYASLLERIYDGFEPTRVLVKLMGEAPAVADHPHASEVQVKEAVDIRLHGVGFTYPRRKEPAVLDLHLTIAPGTVLGIAGRSGCGKTTIQSLLARLFDVQAGSVEICGKDVRVWPLAQLRGTFSHVSQNGGAYFSGMRLCDVLRFTRPEATLREAVQAAKVAYIHEDICRMPQKYKTRIGRGGVTLSRGQQQRIALAQALLAMTGDRRILVLDEFTSALDSETEEKVLRNLEPWLAGRTVIIIAHRISTVRKLAHRIIVLDRSGISEDGTHEELVARGGWYARMARLQAVGTDEEFEAVA